MSVKKPETPRKSKRPRNQGKTFLSRFASTVLGLVPGMQLSGRLFPLFAFSHVVLPFSFFSPPLKERAIKTAQPAFVLSPQFDGKGFLMQAYFSPKKYLERNTLSNMCFPCLFPGIPFPGFSLAVVSLAHSLCFFLRGVSGVAHR